MQTAIVFIRVPLVPIIKCIVSTRKQNLDDIEAWESLNSYIDSSLEKLKKNQKSINGRALYRILGTYHYRKTAFKIPEWLYNRMRNRQEEKLIRWLVNFRIKDIKKKTPNFTFWCAKLSVNLVKSQIIKWYCGERGIRSGFAAWAKRKTPGWEPSIKARRQPHLVAFLAEREGFVPALPLERSEKPRGENPR